MNYEEQKEKTYIEAHNLLKMLPLKYSETREELKRFLDFFNNEVWLK